MVKIGLPVVLQFLKIPPNLFDPSRMDATAIPGMTGEENGADFTRRICAMAAVSGTDFSAATLADPDIAEGGGQAGQARYSY
jgi:hypothetical protein